MALRDSACRGHGVKLFKSRVVPEKEERGPGKWESACCMTRTLLCFYDLENLVNISVKHATKRLSIGRQMN